MSANVHDPVGIAFDDYSPSLIFVGFVLLRYMHLDMGSPEPERQDDRSDRDH